MTAYIEKWNVDIGDKVKKNDVMATLFVPELVEEFGTKKADVELQKQKITLATKMVDVANADVQASQAKLQGAKEELGKYQSEVDRWDTEVKRLQREVDRGVVDPQVLLESKNQLRSNTALREAARAAISQAEAELTSKQASAAAAVVDVQVANAALAVAESEARRLQALVGYLVLPAPFDGIIVARNANTGDFVLPATGDPTAMQRAPDISATGAAPIYVVDRTDIVRIFVDIPEADANYVKIGTPATVLAKAYKDEEIPAKITRTSWALNVTSRTLRAEIDLPNPEAKLLPGMYAYARVVTERPNVRALPKAALIDNGEKTFCLFHANGRAVQTEVTVGITDGEWVEVINHRPANSTRSGWTAFNGSESVILGDLSALVDGTEVRVASTPEAKSEGAKPTQ
jgi:RND family efflux transporter MFP subunit